MSNYDEIRRVRHAMSAQVKHDPKALIDLINRDCADHNQRVIPAPPAKPSQATAVREGREPFGPAVTPPGDDPRRGTRQGFEGFMDKVPSAPPLPGDELPPGTAAS